MPYPCQNWRTLVRRVRTLAAARLDIVLSRIRSMKSKVIQFVAVAQLQSELGECCNKRGGRVGSDFIKNI